MPTAQPTAAAMPQHRSLPELPTHSAACVPAAKSARNECATCRTQPPSPALSHGARAAHVRHNVHGAHTHFRDDPQDIRGELTSDAAKRSRSVALTSVLVIRDAQLYERSPPPLFEATCRFTADAYHCDSTVVAASHRNMRYARWTLFGRSVHDMRTLSGGGGRCRAQPNTCN